MDASGRNPTLLASGGLLALAGLLLVSGNTTYWLIPALLAAVVFAAGEVARDLAETFG